MKFNGVIFDLDGVICFTDEYHYLAWKEMADDMGIYFDREINNRLRGVWREKRSRRMRCTALRDTPTMMRIWKKEAHTPTR